MPTARCSATCKDCAVQISAQHTANHCTRLLPVPLLPPERRGGSPTEETVHSSRAAWALQGARAPPATVEWVPLMLMPHLKQTLAPLPLLGPAEVTVCFSPCSLQLWSLRHFALLCLWSCHRRLPLPAVRHGATLWKMCCTYSVFVITSACGFRSLLSHLPPFHCQKSKQLVKIQNYFTVYAPILHWHIWIFFTACKHLCNQIALGGAPPGRKGNAKSCSQAIFAVYRATCLHKWVNTWLFLQWLITHAIW